jgi:hypothetical protein
MPGKRDTVVVKEYGGKKTYQKRILLYNLREIHQMFLQDNPDMQFFSFYFLVVLRSIVYSISGVQVSRSLFAQLRPPHITVKSSMPHHVCVCVYIIKMSICLLMHYRDLLMDQLVLIYKHLPQQWYVMNQMNNACHQNVITVSTISS